MNEQIKATTIEYSTVTGTTDNNGLVYIGQRLNNKIPIQVVMGYNTWYLCSIVSMAQYINGINLDQYAACIYDQEHHPVTNTEVIIGVLWAAFTSSV